MQGTLSHPSTLFPWLKQVETSPKRGLSQNFLIDANIVRNIVKTARVQSGDCVLEIGPGPGALTQELLKQGAHVIAIEKDARLAFELERLQIDNRLQVIHADFLEYPLQELIRSSPIKVVSNLPYHITSPILGKLCENASLFSSAWIMVQKEVAQRIVAQKNTKDMSSFTIFLKTYCDASIAFKVSKNCFYPVPKVDSCVVELAFRKPIFDDPEAFLPFVRRAFQQRRKMLRSTLGIREEPYASMRPEMLSIEDWNLMKQTIPAVFDDKEPGS